MERYIGTNAQLEFKVEEPGTPDGAFIALGDVSFDFDIVVCGGEDAQLLELLNHLQYSEQPGLVTEAEFRRWLIIEPPRGPRHGKGQRKANRKDRWR